jgi:hypothetical protein
MNVGLDAPDRYNMASAAGAAARDSIWLSRPRQRFHRLGITQPRLNDLLHGKINKFSLDTLTTLAMRAGLRVKVDVRPAA